ncbi:MAG: hypothetical protein FD139_2585 [Methylocystaceae bacterium]|nr:MAG: hypothetical protein FD172_2 [Methylocystaceae bacterium]TXT43895.1 MAG: hypothetical protein FD139_2585 [Methylocystaceae bacterium]
MSNAKTDVVAPERYTGSPHILLLLNVLLSGTMTGASIYALMEVASRGGDIWDAGLVLIVGAGAFGSSVLFSLWVLMHPAALDLYSEGFTLAARWTLAPKKVAWRDIDQFFVYKDKMSKTVVYNFAPGKAPGSLITNLNRTHGFEGWLPLGWRLTPEEMVERLNAYRARALAAQDKFTK